MTTLYFLRSAATLTYFDATGKMIAMVDLTGPIPELIAHGIKRLGVDKTLTRLNSHAELTEIRNRRSAR